MKPAPPAAPPKEKAPVPWRPDWRWHLKALGGIFAFLLVFYAAMTYFLSRLPPPYGLRDVPPEMTPWLKK